MKLQAIFLGVWFVLVVCVIGADDLTTKCAAVVTKVTPCLNFATGTAAAPTKECCDSATSIKESNPECLCFIIQQIHKGSPEVKSMGIQESRLLQLPSACNLKNATISNCPKLLGLPANSPDAAIFTNASTSSKAASPSAADSTKNSSSSTTTSSENGSFGSTLNPNFITDIVAVATTLAILAFPASGLLNNFT